MAASAGAAGAAVEQAGATVERQEVGVPGAGLVVNSAVVTLVAVAKAAA